MAGRDYGRVIVAEDDFDRAREISELLEMIGGYEVWVTKRMMDIRGLLDETNSGWLILDLNLEDGNSTEIVPMLRSRYGTEIFILILSGYFEDYPEYDLLAEGADFYLRKPYEPKALLQQMETLRARMEGKELRKDEGIKLEFNGGTLDLDRGLYVKGKDEITVPGIQLKLVKLLATARDEYGWAYVDRGEAIMYLWGEDFERDPTATTERLRKVRTRLRNSLDFEMTEVKMEGARHNPSYRLVEDVKLVK